MAVGTNPFGSVANIVADVAANPLPRNPIPIAPGVQRFVVEDDYVRAVMGHWLGP